MLAGICWPYKDQNDLGVSKALLPLDICLNPRLAGGPHNSTDPQTVGSAVELLITGCCTD